MLSLKNAHVKVGTLHTIYQRFFECMLKQGGKYPVQREIACNKSFGFVVFS